MSAKPLQSFVRPLVLAVAEGATTPSPGVSGVVVLSSTTNQLMRWTGTLWTSLGATATDIGSGAWTNLTCNTGLTGSPQYRLVGTTVELRGTVAKAGSFAAGAAYTLLLTFPSNIQPSTIRYFACGTGQPTAGTDAVARVAVSTNVVAAVGSFAAGFVALDGIRYDTAA